MQMISAGKTIKFKCNLSKWRDMSCSWVEGYDFINLSISSKLIYRFNADPTKISIGFLAEPDKTIMTFAQKRMRPGRTKTRVKMSRERHLAPPDTKTVALVPGVQIHQQDRLETPEIDPHTDRGGVSILGVRNTFFNK